MIETSAERRDILSRIMRTHTHTHTHTPNFIFSSSLVKEECTRTHKSSKERNLRGKVRQQADADDEWLNEALSFHPLYLVRRLLEEPEKRKLQRSHYYYYCCYFEWGAVATGALHRPWFDIRTSRPARIDQTGPDKSDTANEGVSALPRHNPHT